MNHVPGYERCNDTDDWTNREPVDWKSRVWTDSLFHILTLYLEPKRLQKSSSQHLIVFHANLAKPQTPKIYNVKHQAVGRKPSRLMIKSHPWEKLGKCVDKKKKSQRKYVCLNLRDLNGCSFSFFMISLYLLIITKRWKCVRIYTSSSSS